MALDVRGYASQLEDGRVAQVTQHDAHPLAQPSVWLVWR